MWCEGLKSSIELNVEGTAVSTLSADIINIVLAIFLVIINGFFVAAEFALVKIRPSKLDEQE